MHLDADVIVVGGGHSGIEASLVCARCGFKTLLFTLNIDNIGQMSCNPSIGGLAKGHLVKEVDALGGEIGRLADRTMVQFRMLNRSKGPAVWSPRSQNDRLLYKIAAQRVLVQTPNLSIKQEEVCEIVINQKKAIGVRTTIGNEYLSKIVILTTGTFLNGLLHIGLQTLNGGRLGEERAGRLSDSLRKIGFNLGRLKTGTSPRVNLKSVNVAELEIQNGEEPPLPFSFRTKEINIKQLPCYITRTNENTHKIIQRNLDRSPLYTGKIVGIGPRYCPSIETKVVKFPDRPSHIIFIEPEGFDSGEYYLNGLSTSLPYDVQVDILHSIKGLEKAEITRPGYAVEYDFLYPIQLYPTLETKLIQNLYCAGQINGTSGYEEAAAQGFVAGINAVLKLRGEEPFILKRYEAYIGVLIDDLVTKNTIEPYRMFTSLAEHRLILRIDNVYDRLMPYGVKLGLISKDEYRTFEDERNEINEAIKKLKEITIKPEIANPILLKKKENILASGNATSTLFQLLKRPNINWQDINEMANLKLNERIGFRTEIEVKYEGYIEREKEMIKKLQELEVIKVPENFNYEEIRGLSSEAKSKLNEVKPQNLLQASKIQGIGPSDILLLLLYIKRDAR
uniref:tRNA uridine 5-carboxymethylaminomethyl modification enzyme MnmG n=1 Tax=candidate division WOR-3 bacterium TaxID=2052148 RepID=A0A7C4TFY1_UNCW3